MSDLKTLPSIFRPIVLLICLVCVAHDAYAQRQTFPNNSMIKERIQPNPQAMRIGSAVHWQPDLETALATAKATGKPVFWYVPTLRGSFMDRSDSIDRYMQAGPFSWPDTISILNEHFVPINAAPRIQQQNQFDLKPYAFVEPGFLVLDSDGTLISKMDRLTTLHPIWFRHLLTRHIAGPVPQSMLSTTLDPLWHSFSVGEFEPIKRFFEIDPPQDVESFLLAGMAEFRLGDHDSAKALWEQASEIDPESPLAWKAAAEAAGFGPFVRGFETHRQLPPGAFVESSDTAGSSAPRNVYDSPELWRRSVDFLIGMQDQSGAWTDSDYDFGGTDSLPNVHAAVTAIAGMALVEAQRHFADDLPMRNKIENAILRAANYVADDKNLNLADRDEILWAFAYRVRFLSRIVTFYPQHVASLKRCVERLESIQNETGGWFHEYDNPFVTATALLALTESAAAGTPADSKTIRQGLAALAHDRFDNGAFPYSSLPMHRPQSPGTQQQIAASAGRMPLCELALWFGKKSTDDQLVQAVERSLALNEHLMQAIKYDDHTSNMAYGGFFVWYDIAGRSEAIAQINDESLKAKFQSQQQALILSLPEIDGCFVDSHELGRVYGTAMALLSLANIDNKK